VRSSKVIVAVCAVAALAFSTVVMAGAAITGSTGQVIRLTTPPASVALNKLENATSTYAFDEAQGKTLTSAIAVDAVNPGTYTTFPAGSAKIAAGTVVDSHLIHSDIPSRNFTSHRTGSVTFSQDILGVVASTAKLASSDTLGAPGTTYAGTTQWRGLESSENGFSSLGDKFTISTDKRTVTFDINTFVMDELRVITKHANPLVTSISDSPDPVQVGENVTYTITVNNTGGTAATGVQVADAFPGATLVSATSSGGCTGTTTVTCGLGTIAAGGSAAATVVVTSPSTSGTLTNTATSPPGQPIAATATTTVVSQSLSTAITDSPDPVTAGNDVQYTLTVTNNGIAAVADAHVIDTLPAGASLASAPAACSGTGPVDCSVGALAVGGSGTVQIVVTSPATVPSGGTMTNSAVATPGSNTAGTQVTTVEAPQDGVAKGFVSPGGSLTIPGDDPATLSLPDTGDGAPVIVTQGDGTFCEGPCSGTATEISEFGGYSDPNQPIVLDLTYNFPASPTSLTDAATAFGATIYKNDDPGTPNVGVPVPFCSTLGAGVANPHPCVDGRTIVQTTPDTYVVTFKILYISGDPKFARR
jgi:uncharacterized repeat protein (TIGR01451 family)